MQLHRVAGHVDAHDTGHSVGLPRADRTIRVARRDKAVRVASVSGRFAATETGHVLQDVWVACRELIGGVHQLGRPRHHVGYERESRQRDTLRVSRRRLSGRDDWRRKCGRFCINRGGFDRAIRPGLGAGHFRAAPGVEHAKPNGHDGYHSSDQYPWWPARPRRTGCSGSFPSNLPFCRHESDLISESHRITVTRREFPVTGKTIR